MGRLILSRSISIMSCATFMYVYCTYVPYIYMCVQCTGAGDREGFSYQRVNVDDGTEAVGTVGQLVHQTTTLHAHLGHSLYHSLQGDYLRGLEI